MGRSLHWGVLLGLAACVGPIEDKETTLSGDTSGLTNTGETGLDCNTPAPILIATLDVTCNAGQDSVRFEVGTSGITGDGLIFTQETGNQGSTQYADEHTLVSFDADPCGQFDTLERDIDIDVAAGGSVPDTSTIFTCANHYDLRDTFMSYVVRVYDGAGNLADCWAVGHDPQEVIDGGGRVSDPVSPAELANCQVQQGTY